LPRRLGAQYGLGGVEECRHPDRRFLNFQTQRVEFGCHIVDGFLVPRAADKAVADRRQLFDMLKLAAALDLLD